MGEYTGSEHELHATAGAILIAHDTQNRSPNTKALADQDRFGARHGMAVNDRTIAAGKVGQMQFSRFFRQLRMFT